MTLTKPPALATWILEHLALGIDKDALAGDLLEEFRHRRSVAWYWRQVLMAIFLGFSKQLGRQWRAAGFALAWTVGSAIALPVLYRSMYQTSQFQSMFGWASMHDFPESIIVFMSLQMSPVFLLWWFGLAFYLVMMRSFSARRFGRGLLINLFFGLLAFGFDLSGWGIVLMRKLPVQALPFAHQTPYFLALMLSIGATLPTRAIKRAKRIRVSE
jgi:hypothetical protein